MIQVIKLSNNTKNYITSYYGILDEIHQNCKGENAPIGISSTYINLSIPLLEGGVKICENILKYTTDTEIENFSKKHIEIQKIYIKKFKSIKDVSLNYQNENKDISLYSRTNKALTSNLFHEMENSPSTNNLDMDFLYEILSCFEGFIKLAKNALAYDLSPDLKITLEELIDVLNKANGQIKTSLRKN